MAALPEWLDELVQAAASCLTAHGPDSPLGLRYRDLGDVWDVLVYAMPVEMVGGAHDGGRACPSFSLDFDGLRAAFTRVDACRWDAHGAGPDNDGAGPCVALEGEYAGRPVWLRLLAHAPADIGPAVKVDANGRG